MTNALKMAKTVQTIPDNLVCNAGKAGMVCAILHMKKCNGLRKHV
jgi:hypothetical protein